MQVNDEIKKEWEQLREWGDVKAISVHSGLSKPTITSALDTGSMSMETFTAIQKFYNERKAAIEKLKQ